MKSKIDNPNGLHLKYYIEKLDGEPLDPGFEGFLLRLDENGEANHVAASRKALLVYADEIESYIPQLAEDIRKQYG